ncbi:MAG: penicillin acylase family protein [Planctomycetota bacterium]
MFKSKISLSIIMVILLCTSLQAYEKGVLEYDHYKIPWVNGTTNLDSMKGLGFVMGWYCPTELFAMYSSAWGLNAYYQAYNQTIEPPAPGVPWYTDLDDAGWIDYAIALMEVRKLAGLGYRFMTTAEKRVISAFCDGINEAIQQIKQVDPDWYDDNLQKYEKHFNSSSGLCIKPVHVLALNLYDFAVPVVLDHVLDASHFPEFGLVKNPIEFVFQSQQWAFVDNDHVPWIQLDTHLLYTPGNYRPFPVQVTTDEVDGPDVGINYFGYNLLGLPFPGDCVRYAREGLSPLAWGFTAHYGDLVDLYVMDYIEDGPGVYKYKWTEDDWVELTKREDIIIDFNEEFEYDDLVIDDVYETLHHGPVVRLNEDTHKVYAIRGCWDRHRNSLNIVREGVGMLKAEDIEQAITVMDETRCLPTGNVVFANGAGDPNGGSPNMLKYILKGPLPDRKGLLHFEDFKYDSKNWVDGFIDGSQGANGKDNIFQRLYDYIELPQDHYRPNDGVNFFINCNCSINHNNPNSSAGSEDPLNLERWLDNEGASLVWGDCLQLRQKRALDLVDYDPNFAVNRDYLIDHFLLDPCQNLAVMLIEDLEDVYIEAIDEITDPYEQAQITAAKTLLEEWRYGDPGDIADDAPASKTSTVMFLFKLWEAYFMADVCEAQKERWEKVFAIPPYRNTIIQEGIELGDPDFCMKTLMALYKAYHNEWNNNDYYPTSESKQWQNHIKFYRETVGTEGGILYPTDGDERTLMLNMPFNFHWFNDIRINANGPGKFIVGDGQSAPVLAKLDPINGITIYYSRAVDSCLEATRIEMNDVVAGHGHKVFDNSCPSTLNWTNRFFEELHPD